MFDQIKQIDIFGADLPITVMNSKKMKTMQGAILTILTLCFFVFVVISFGDNFYYMKNPKVIMQRKVLSNDELYDLNNSTVKSRILILKISKLMDQVSNFLIDASIPFSFQSNKTYGIVQNCNHTWILETFYPDNFKMGEEDLSTDWSYLCYNMADFKFGLMDNGAGQGSILVNPVSIWTFGCGRSARGVKGKDCPIDYDPEFAPNISVDIEMWTEDVLFDQDNLLTPFSSTLTRVGKYQMTRDQYIDAYLSMLVHKNYDNKGFILDTAIEKVDLGFGSIDYLQVPLTKPNDYYDFTIYLGYDKNFTRYVRTYMKIQDLLALVGGTLKFVITLFQLISYFNSEYSLIKHLINDYYDLNKKSHSKTINFSRLVNEVIPSKIPQNNTEMKKAININNIPGKNRSGILINDCSNTDLNVLNRGNHANAADQKYKTNNFMHCETKLTLNHRFDNFGFVEYVKSKLGFSRQNLMKEISNIQQKHSIEHLFKIMKDVVLLKHLLLTPQQINSIKLIKGMVLDNNDCNDDKRMIEMDIYQYFEFKLKSNDITDIDAKLLDQIKSSFNL